MWVLFIMWEISRVSFKFQKRLAKKYYNFCCGDDSNVKLLIIRYIEQMLPRLLCQK